MSRKAIRYFAALLAALLCVSLISFTAFGEDSSNISSLGASQISSFPESSDISSVNSMVSSSESDSSPSEVDTTPTEGETGGTDGEVGHETVSPSEVMVTFDLAGGTGPTSKYLDKGTKISELKDAKRDGYTFVAWMYNGTEVSDSFSIDTDITLTAEWKQNPAASSSTDTDDASDTISVADSDPGVTASQDWNALLNPSSAENQSDVSSSIISGISSTPSQTTTSGRKFSSLFYIGIVLIALGLAGIGTFIYLFVLGKREGGGGPKGGASSGGDAEQEEDFTDITSYSDGKLHNDADSLGSEQAPDSNAENPGWNGNLDGDEKK